MGNCLAFHPTTYEPVYKPKTWESAETEMITLVEKHEMGIYEKMENHAGPFAFPFKIKGYFCKVILKTKRRNDFKVEFNIQQVQKVIGDNTKQPFFLFPERIEHMPNSTIFMYELLECDMVDWVHNNEWSIVQRNNIFTKICAAIDFLHDRDIVHRDIKLENICMRNNEPVIIDLDFSGPANIYKFKGTKDYMPPSHTIQQMLLHRTDIDMHMKTKWLDTYALGKTLALVLCVENTRMNSKPNNVLRKVWKEWGRKRQASLRPVVAVPGELYLISWWWKLVFSFCYHNDEAVFDKTKEFSDIKLYKKIIKNIYH